jgi:hypothetical protein
MGTQFAANSILYHSFRVLLNVKLKRVLIFGSYIILDLFIYIIIRRVVNYPTFGEVTLKHCLFV